MAGFYVDRGILKYQGVAVRELGLNVPDLFMAWLANTDPTKAPSSLTPVIYQTNYATNFDTIIAAGIRVIRFSLLGFRPLTFQKSWVEQNATFLTNLDALIASAEAKGILLIPSLCFNASQIPPYYSEHLSAIGDPTSLTYAAIQSMVEIIVNRYKGSSAIAMWEFSNENDLQVGNSGNIPNSPGATPNIGYSLDSSMGTPVAWTYPDDCYTAETVLNFHRMLQSAIRRKDTAPAYQNSTPRATMSGNYGARSRVIAKTKVDFFTERLSLDVSDTLTSHQYESSSYYSGDYTGFEVFIGRMKAAAAVQKKPYIIGEFGVATNYTSSSRAASQQLARATASIMQAGIQLAMLWNFPAVTGTDANTSMRSDEARAAEFAFYAEQNRLYRMGS